MSSSPDGPFTDADCDSQLRPTPPISNANDCVAIAKYQKPDPNKSHVMIGRLLAQFGGVLFYPLGALRTWVEFAFRPQLEGVPESASCEEEEWYMNDNARKFLAYAKSFTPRLLFRGFNSGSGGGDINLNGRHGVIPHGFLQGKPLINMWDTPGLFYMICDHLGNEREMASDFSSWTQHWMTALQFSLKRKTTRGRIAVLDTTSIQDRIWHTVDLRRARMSCEEFWNEYLVYGPIKGAKYHYISPRKLYKATRIKELLRSDEFLFGEDPSPSLIERGAVQSAMEVAAFLQPHGACVENLAVLTARFVSYRALAICKGQRGVMQYVDMDKYLRYARDHVQYLAMHSEDGEISLVDDTMFTGERCLKFELHLLQAVENAVRVMAFEVRVAMWEVYRPFNMNVDWPIYVMDRTHLETGDERVDATISFLFMLAKASKGGTGAVHEK